LTYHILVVFLFPVQVPPPQSPSPSTLFSPIALPSLSCYLLWIHLTWWISFFPPSGLMPEEPLSLSPFEPTTNHVPSKASPHLSLFFSCVK
jgi:hypothetical protein